MSSPLRKFRVKYGDDVPESIIHAVAVVSKQYHWRSTSQSCAYIPTETLAARNRENCRRGSTPSLNDGERLGVAKGIDNPTGTTSFPAFSHSPVQKYLALNNRRKERHGSLRQETVIKVSFETMFTTKPSSHPARKRPSGKECRWCCLRRRGRLHSVGRRARSR
ncbi:hypothetical protein VTI74DRAFT_11294 [Chaetomium olivicolor]